MIETTGGSGVTVRNNLMVGSGVDGFDVENGVVTNNYFGYNKSDDLMTTHRVIRLLT